LLLDHFRLVGRHPLLRSYRLIFAIGIHKSKIISAR
jgi:hypothetical protein